MSSLPRKFNLINYTWSIKEVQREFIDNAMINQGPPGSFGGFCDRAGLTVAIAKDFPEQEKPRAILHEVLHACFKNKHNIDKEVEEDIVCLLEERLTDLIKNNPKLINYLQENL